MSKFRFLTAGESHGKCLTAIIEGVPAGFEINIDLINNELKRRQQGYGRGERMNIECDTVEITSGIRFGKTLGSPITLVIQNKDSLLTARNDILSEYCFLLIIPILA